MEAQTIGTGNPLAHADLAVPPLHIPDGKGGCYKTELVLERSQERVVKIHWWHGPDPRREPHNHPWEFFRSTILSGGYTETRWILNKDSGTWWSATRFYRKGEINEMPRDAFHTVDSVLPGTVTKMETGPLVEGGDWGYLVPANPDISHTVIRNGDVGTYEKEEPDPKFFEQLCELNPHKRPRA